jgi:cysteine dioxygenase
MPSSTLLCPTMPKLQPVLEYLLGLHRRADLQVLHRLLTELDIDRGDLDPACVFGERGYRRNIVRETPSFELVVLCWRSGQRTPIHDHEGSSCAFKVISGTAAETLFDRTPAGLITPRTTRHLPPGYVCAAEEHDIHQVSNQMPAGQNLVTLHIYSPPFRNYNKYSLETTTIERMAVNDDDEFDGGAGI